MYMFVKMKEVSIMTKVDKIKEIVDQNDGILTMNLLEQNNIHRQYVKALVDEGYLEKEWSAQVKLMTNQKGISQNGWCLFMSGEAWKLIIIAV